MTHRCHSCGYDSANSRFFRRETGGIWRRKVTLCAGCAPYRPSRQARQAQHGGVVNTVLMALFAFSYTSQYGTLADGWALFAGACLSLPFNILAHELGHAFVAKVLGCPVLYVEVGKGPKLASTRLAGIRIDWRRYVFLGAETRYLPPDDLARPKRAAIALAGPLANLMLALVFGFLPMLFGSAQSMVWAAACSGLMLSNLGLALINLAVWRFPDTHAPGGAVQSDGARILAAFRRHPTFDEEARARRDAERLSLLGRQDDAVAAYAALLAQRPNDDFLLCNIIHLTDCVEGPQAGLAAYERLVASGPPRQAFWDVGLMQAYLLGNLAWLSLKTGAPADLDQADYFAPLALAGIPASPEIQATMGALDVRRGRLDAGVPRLLTGLRGSTNPIDRADFCAFLADAYRAREDVAMADDYDSLARRLLASHAQ